MSAASVLELTLDAPPALDAEAIAVVVVVVLVTIAPPEALAPPVVLAPPVALALTLVDELTPLVSTPTEPVLAAVGSDAVVPVPVATCDMVLVGWSTGSSEEHPQVLAPHMNAKQK